MLMLKKLLFIFVFLGIISNLKARAAEPTESGDSFNFVAIADSESYSSGYNSELVTIVNKTKSLNPDFAFFTGDILANDNSSSAKGRIYAVKRLMEQNFKKSYIAFGKHDIECGLACVNLWTKTFWGRFFGPHEKVKLYHSFDYKNTHFVILSSDYPLKHSIDDIQLNWLASDLKKTDKPNKIVVTHVPPITFFSKSAKECHDMSCHKTQRDKLLNILKTNAVDLVISGHEHVFYHKTWNNIDFVISGNSGNSARYDQKEEDIFCQIFVNGKSIVLKAIDKKGKVKKEIRIK